MFYRKIEKKLNEYYSNIDAPILVIDGARQIGKSFIIRHTASKYFKNYVEIDLRADYEGDKIFQNVNNIESFYLQVSALYGDKLNNVEDTIIFLDEIQTFPHLITLLKYLKQDGRYRYIASGSLLGITLKHIFIPMGYIEEVKMYPMDFEEFLYAYGVNKEVVNYLKESFINLTPIDDGIHKTIFHRFREYLICGGLPQAVTEYIINKNVYNVRTVQNSIFEHYKDDASKYDLLKNLKVRRIYDLLPSYMENKVKRQMARKIEDKDHISLVHYEDEFDYLINSGTAISVKAVSNPEFPLCESMSKNLIKLYYNDVGILSNLLFRNNINAILNYDIQPNLGSVYETVCAMELICHGHTPYYFDSKKVGEVDFLVNDYNLLSCACIEIKSGRDQNNFRALPKLIKEPYNLKRGYVFGNQNIVSIDGNTITLPIYMIMFI